MEMVPRRGLGAFSQAMKAHPDLSRQTFTYNAGTQAKNSSFGDGTTACPRSSSGSGQIPSSVRCGTYDFPA